MAAPAQPQQKKTLLMTEGSIWKSILLFSVPLILGNLLQQLYQIVFHHRVLGVLGQLCLTDFHAP